MKRPTCAGTAVQGNLELPCLGSTHPDVLLPHGRASYSPCCGLTVVTQLCLGWGLPFCGSLPLSQLSPGFIQLSLPGRCRKWEPFHTWQDKPLLSLSVGPLTDLHRSLFVSFPEASQPNSIFLIVTNSSAFLSPPHVASVNMLPSPSPSPSPSRPLAGCLCTTCSLMPSGLGVTQQDTPPQYPLSWVPFWS